MPVKHKKQMVKWIGAVKQGYHALAGKQISRAVNNKAVGAIQSFKKGGKVARTGLAHVHKGEVVLTCGQAKSLKKVLA